MIINSTRWFLPMNQFGQLALARRQPQRKLRSKDQDDNDGDDHQNVGRYCEDDDDNDD